MVVSHTRLNPCVAAPVSQHLMRLIIKPVMLRWLWWALALAGLPLGAQTTIIWYSDAGMTNLTSGGIPLDSQFVFELGVFDTSFIPTSGNTDQWAAHWHAASRTPYIVANSRYAATFTPTDNVAPFTVPTPAYVWGFRGDAASSEWILFRNPSWTWPSAASFPSSVNWWAKDATLSDIVVGSIHSGGSPFLMQTAAITNAAPPTTTWSQWQAQTLAGQSLDGPNDDPDHDGTPNMLEYVFGTGPLAAGAPTATPLAVVSGHLQMTIPRRIDHPATLVVEVSDDLTNWYSGSSYTAVVSDGLTALVVRDLATVGVSHPKRFMRVRAELASP